MEIKNIKGETAMNCAASAMAKSAIRLLQDLGAYGNWAPLPLAPDLPLRIFLTAPHGTEAERKAFMEDVSLAVNATSEAFGREVSIVDLS